MPVLVDAHIHFHPCFNAEKFFDEGRNNFHSFATQQEIISFQSVLCFTESFGCNIFGELSKKADNREKIGAWDIQKTDEQNSLLLKDSAGFEIFVIAGRQIVTKEKLEVLALGLKEDIHEGKPAGEVIKQVIASHSLPVLPWGFGKWLGKRGKIILELVSSQKYSCYLGDNGNRPWFMGKSRVFAMGLDGGMFNLPGSDPLPFVSEVVKPGSFGCIMEGSLRNKQPFHDLYELITQASKPFAQFGKPESAAHFLRNQIAMQLVKRSRKSINS
jgi:hypothetical protein